MSMIGFPLLLIPLAIYNIIVFLMPGTPLGAPLFAVPLMSGVIWQVTLSDILIGVGILMLMFEVMKGARPGGKYLTDHLLAFLVLGGAVAEFLLLPQFGTSTFAMLTALALVDFLGGLALRGRRVRAAAAPIARDEPVAPAPVEAPVRTEPRLEQKLEPKAEPAPTAAPMAEAVLSDRPAAPAIAPAAVKPVEIEQAPSSAPASAPALQNVPPRLQPANDHSSPDQPPR